MCPRRIQECVGPFLNVVSHQELTDPRTVIRHFLQIFDRRLETIKFSYLSVARVRFYNRVSFLTNSQRAFLSNFECLSRIQPPGKPPETRFCDLKTSTVKAPTGLYEN